MSGDNLNRALWDIQIPEPPGAEDRGRRVLAAAYAERKRDRSAVRGAITPRTSERRSRRPLPRLALGLSLAALLAILLLSPAGAAVRDWVGDTFSAPPPRPEPTLARIPGGGRLLVQTGEGPVVVQPDGSKRLLGDYEGASWSPHGLFVAAVKGRSLSALEPDGTRRWSITAAQRVANPRWSPSGERIAYRSGESLRIVAGDGSGDHLVNPEIAPVAPAWSPFGTPELAYVNGEGQLRIAASEKSASRSGAPPDMARAVVGPRVRKIDWGAGGQSILEVSPGSLHLQGMRLNKLEGRSEFRRRTSLPIAPGATVVDAALAPQRPLVAVSITFWKKHGTYSEAVVYRPGKQPRTLLSVPGSLGQVEWSPDGRRLLVAWPGANQWLFLPLGRGRGRAIADISKAIAPSGRPTSFPLLAGWCCRR
jgi:hypothetical protein